MYNKSYSDINGKTKKEKQTDVIIIAASVILSVGYFGGHVVFWMLNK